MNVLNLQKCVALSLLKMRSLKKFKSKGTLVEDVHEVMVEDVHEDEVVEGAMQGVPLDENRPQVLILYIY